MWCNRALNKVGAFKFKILMISGVQSVPGRANWETTCYEIYTQPVRPCWAGKYLWQLLTAVKICSCNNATSPGLKAEVTAVSPPRALCHSTPDSGKGTPLLPARSCKIISYLLYYHLQLTAAAHMMDLSGSHSAGKQSDINHDLMPHVQLGSRRWYTLVIALSQNHKIFISLCVPASSTLAMPLQW